MEGIPRHVGIIVDGNRRWAREHGLAPWEGHREGAKKLEKVLEWCKELGVEEATLYLFSIQNFNREKAEVEMLLKLFEAYADRFFSEKFTEKNYRIRFLGRLDLFPARLAEKLKKIAATTKKRDVEFTLNLCVGYGGREEIVDAAKKIAAEVQAEKLAVEDIDNETFAQYLYMADEPEMIIRTSGEHRSSNFLPWQSTYAEWFYPKTFFPALEREELEAMFTEFASQRKRRFGK